MSLLMDALRKAEESRKKAESGPAPKKGQDAVSDQASHSSETAQQPATPRRATVSPPASPSANPSAKPAPVAPTVQAPASRPGPGSSIPDLPLDFQDSDEPGKQEQTQDAPADKASPAGESALELAPQEATATRQPFIGEPDEQVSIQSQAKEPSDSLKSLAEEKPSAQKESASDKEPLANREPSADKEPSASKEPSADKEPSANKEPARPGGPGTESSKGAGVKTPANKPASKLELAVENQPGRNESGDFSVKAEAPQSVEKPAELALADKAPGIRERTARSRASARSVFAAKQQGSGKRRRQLLVLGAAAAVVLLLLGGGLLMMLNTDSGSGITVPDNYVVGQSQSEQLEQASEQQELSGAASVDEAGPEEAEQAVALADTDSNSTVRFTTLATLPADTAESAPMPAIDTLEEEALSASPTQAAATAQASASIDNSNTDQAPAEEVLADTGDATATVSDNNEPELAGSAAQPESNTEAPTAAVAQINFTRRQADPTLQPLLNEAYAAYQRGDLVLARQRYQAALADSPMHRDALLGLAAIAVAEQQPAQAMDYYSRMLARNPADPVARAALLELSPAGGPATQERELRRLLDLHPQVASLAYAMGNFYASRQQWSDAQQYYFRALQLARSQAEEPRQINPDYAYNLAVSLEHLNQARAAITFYQEALTQAESQQAGFDLSGARRRVETLSRTLTP